MNQGGRSPRERADTRMGQAARRCRSADPAMQLARPERIRRRGAGRERATSGRAFGTASAGGWPERWQAVTGREAAITPRGGSRECVRHAGERPYRTARQSDGGRAIHTVRAGTRTAVATTAVARAIVARVRHHDRRDVLDNLLRRRHPKHERQQDEPPHPPDRPHRGACRPGTHDAEGGGVCHLRVDSDWPGGCRQPCPAAPTSSRSKSRWRTTRGSQCARGYSSASESMGSSSRWNSR
jgi:hypothetical protein